MMADQHKQLRARKGARHLLVLALGFVGLMVAPTSGQIQDLRQPIQRKDNLSPAGIPGQAPEVTIKDGQLFPAPPPQSTQSNSGSSVGDGVLITWPFKVRHTVLAELTDSIIATADGSEGWIEQPLKDLIAFVRVNPRFELRAPGAVTLIDGQRLPGEANHSDSDEPGQLAWRHPWLGPINIPLEQISSIAFDYTGIPKALPGASRRDGDVIFLANGDELEGFLLEIGTTVQVEVASELRKVPVDQVRAIEMMPNQAPPTGRRVTFRDGTIIDVGEIRIGLDGYTRLSESTLDLLDRMPPSTDLPRSTEINSVAFEPDQFQSLTTIKPIRVTSPPTRFYSAPPVIRRVGPDPLLSHIDIQGPVEVTYELPAGASHFSSLIGLAEQVPAWANLQILVSVDGQQLWRTTLSRDRATAIIDIPIDGRQLTIALLEGKASSTGDRIALVYPLIRVTDSSTK